MRRAQREQRPNRDPGSIAKEARERWLHARGEIDAADGDEVLTARAELRAIRSALGVDDDTPLGDVLHAAVLLRRIALRTGAYARVIS